MGSKLSLFSLYGQRFLRYGLIFKIAILAWNLVIGQSSKYALILPLGVEIELIQAQLTLYRKHFLRNWPIFKIAIFGHKTWQVAKVSEVAHIHVLSFYPSGLKLRLFLLYGQRFLTYRPIFKIAIFGHETLSLTKDPEVAHNSPFLTPGGRNWAYFRSTGSGF